MSVPVGWDTAAAVRDWPGLPPLPGDATADACVIGLGASGLAAVDALAARGLQVIGLDAGRVAGGAAGRNGGFLLGGGAPFLHDAIAAWGECAVDLYRATLGEIDRLGNVLPRGMLRRVGSIRLAGLPGPAADDAEAADRERELADLAVHAAALRTHGIAVEDYDGPLGRGIVLPDDAVVNPAVRALALAADLRGRARLHEHTPVRTVAAGAVGTARGAVTAPVVIVAVDGGLDVLLPQLARRVRTARLQMLATARVAPVLPCAVYGRWGYDYAQQDGSGRLLVGGGRDRATAAEWTTDTTPTPPVQDWIETVAERVAGEPVTVEHRWAASVGYTGDGRALCTVVDETAAGIVVAVGGYSGTGNLVGPVAARAAVTRAVDGTPPPAYLAS